MLSSLRVSARRMARPAVSATSRGFCSAPVTQLSPEETRRRLENCEEYVVCLLRSLLRVHRKTRSTAVLVQLRTALLMLLDRIASLEMRVGLEGRTGPPLPRLTQMESIMVELCELEPIFSIFERVTRLEVAFEAAGF